MQKYIVTSLIFRVLLSAAQISDSTLMDTISRRHVRKVTVAGNVDGYYTSDFRSSDGDRPYSVSMSRLNKLAINLAFLDVQYSSSRVRVRIVPGFGSYMKENYRQERGIFKYL